MRILICGGAGSIGQKHKVNLEILGYNDIDIADPVLPEAKYKDIYDVGLNDGRYALAIICTPTEDHLEHLHYLNDRGFSYIMVEKPLYKYPTGNQLVMEAGLSITMRPLNANVYINNCYKFARSLLKLKECLPLVGKIWQASLENQYAFDKLHKYSYEDYEGILSDDVHMINVSRFILGEPKRIIGKAILKNFAQWLWETESGVLVAHKTHMLDQRYKKRIEISGDKGTLVWNWRAHEIFFCPADESERIAIPCKHSCHLMESLKYVLNVVEEQGEFTINTIEDGLRDMVILEELQN